MEEKDLIAQLDAMMNSGVSRLKIDMSEDIVEGESVKKYHHGRCDVGSPFATGKLFDLDEANNGKC